MLPLRHHITASPLPPNRFFTEAMLETLLRPQAWMLVASALPMEVAPLEDVRHRDWMATHTHVHAHREVLVPLAGVGRFGLAGRIYPSAPGMLFIIAGFEAHDVHYPDWSEDLDHLWLSVLRDHCVARLITAREGASRLSSAWSCLVTHEESGPALDLERESAGAPPSVARMRVVGALSLLIGAVVRQGYTEEREEERHSFQARIVRTICEHIEHTAGNGASLEHLAHIAGYSTFHFLRLFKAHTGCTVHEYIDRSRLRRAHEMQEQGCPQKEVAAALGFSCPSAFSRWYRRRRQSPSGSLPLYDPAPLPSGPSAEPASRRSATSSSSRSARSS
ncbi:MAG: helix-turn-helix transcriptional regulator [Armatimonadetes bacterium]|nr:helix-turn-helix transcriptional regulator [Armatimonadota bacterium]